eukprot:616857-Amorphochlora_amoeboformis.AAC.1
MILGNLISTNSQQIPNFARDNASRGREGIAAKLNLPPGSPVADFVPKLGKKCQHSAASPSENPLGNLLGHGAKDAPRGTIVRSQIPSRVARRRTSGAISRLVSVCLENQGSEQPGEPMRGAGA